jgi:hypothetical protein
MTRGFFSCALAISLLVVSAFAQRGGHNGFPVLSPSAPMRGGLGFGPHEGHHRPFPSGVFFGSPFWGDGYYPYYPDPAPTYVVQPSPKPLEYPKSLAPLVIELQGDHYVRRSLDESTTQSEPAVTSASARSPSSAGKQSATRSNAVAPRLNAAQESASALSPTLSEAPTVFVFRDGHREESSDYSIISGVIYSRGDYWTTGSWSKKILIADLDVPATMQANRERSVAFRLPNAPNEIITRP